MTKRNPTLNVRALVHEIVEWALWAAAAIAIGAAAGVLAVAIGGAW